MTESSARRLVRIYDAHAEALIESKYAVCNAAHILCEEILKDDESRAQLDRFFSAFMSAYIEAYQGKRRYAPEPMLIFGIKCREQKVVIGAVLAMLDANPQGIARTFLEHLRKDESISIEARSDARWALSS